MLEDARKKMRDVAHLPVSDVEKREAAEANQKLRMKRQRNKHTHDRLVKAASNNPERYIHDLMLFLDAYIPDLPECIEQKDEILMLLFEQGLKALTAYEE